MFDPVGLECCCLGPAKQEHLKSILGGQTEVVDTYNYVILHVNCILSLTA